MFIAFCSDGCEAQKTTSSTILSPIDSITGGLCGGVVESRMKPYHPACRQSSDQGHLSGLVGLRKLELRFTRVNNVGENELSKVLPKRRIYR